MTIDCIFCKILAGEVPSKLVYEDEVCVAFNDINPQAPTHILIIPRIHLASLNETKEEDVKVLGHLLLTASGIAQTKDFAEKGYRVVINTNENGGQTVFHLHVHLLGGRQFIFPPG